MQKLKKKETRLNAALQKVQNHLKYLSDKYGGKPLSERTGEELKEVEQWNNWHDLEERLTRRIKKNWSEYHSWHFEKFGWTAY